MNKKIAVALATGALLLSAASALAAPLPKVDVCHIIEANDVVYGFWGTQLDLYFGKVISVSENALPAHLERGDLTEFWAGETAAGPIATFQAAGVHLPAADCYYGLWPDGSTVPAAPTY